MSSTYDVETLIELVKSHVYLYDITHKKYKDASLKAATWESIAQKLNRSYESVKHKWKTVRDGYIKYKKQLKQSEESGKKIIEYVWSTKLQFLDDYQVTRRRNKDLSWSATSVVDLIDEKCDSSPSAHSPSNSQYVDDPFVTRDGEPPTKRKRTELQPGDVDLILNYVNNARLKSNDAVDHLFMSYAETFKTFSPRRQAEMKIQLAKLFSNAELKELDHADDSHQYEYQVKAEHFLVGN